MFRPFAVFDVPAFAKHQRALVVGQQGHRPAIMALHRRFVEAEVPQHAPKRPEQVRLGKHLPDRPRRQHRAVHQHDMVAELRDRTQIVRRDEDDVPVVPQLPQERDDRRLCVHIHPGEGLVQQDHPPALGQRPGEKDPLALPARQFADLPFAKLQHADPPQALLRDAPVLRPRGPHKIHVTVPAHQHHVPHADRKTPIDLLGLRHVGHEVLFQRRLHRPAGDRHRARDRLEQPHDRLEQRGFPAAVHAHEGTDRTARERKRRVAQRHVAIRVAHRDRTHPHTHLPRGGFCLRRVTHGRGTLSRSSAHCSPSVSNTSAPGPSHPSTSRRRARRRNAPPSPAPPAARAWDSPCFR